MRFIIKVASLGWIFILTGGFAFADSFTINLTNKSEQVLYVCQEDVSGKNKAGAANTCGTYSANLVASVEEDVKDEIIVSSNNNLMFFCNTTPITKINFSKDNPAKQCSSQFSGWSTACGVDSFSCSAEENDIDVTLI